MCMSFQSSTFVPVSLSRSSFLPWQQGALFNSSSELKSGSVRASDPSPTVHLPAAAPGPSPGPVRAKKPQRASERISCARISIVKTRSTDIPSGALHGGGIYAVEGGDAGGASKEKTPPPLSPKSEAPLPSHWIRLSLSVRCLVRLCTVGDHDLDRVRRRRRRRDRGDDRCGRRSDSEFDCEGCPCRLSRGRGAAGCGPL